MSGFAFEKCAISPLTVADIFRRAVLLPGRAKCRAYTDPFFGFEFRRPSADTENLFIVDFRRQQKIASLVYLQCWGGHSLQHQVYVLDLVTGIRAYSGFLCLT